MKRICVFCGSRPGTDPRYVDAAQELGTLIANRGLGLVYGGGGRGMMGAVADAALAAGGHVIGVIPENLFAREHLHTGITKTLAVGSMHERKATMAKLSSGFIALPGGIGTMEELFEMWTWNQLNILNKPCGLLNVEGYFDALVEFLSNMTTSQFMSADSRDLVQIDTDPGDLLEAILRGHD